MPLPPLTNVAPQPPGGVSADENPAPAANPAANPPPVNPAAAATIAAATVADPAVPAGMTATQSAPMIGKDLTRIVLNITAGAIALLVFYLLFMDLRIAADIDHIFQSKSRDAHIESGGYASARLNQLYGDFGAARDPKWQAPPESIAYDKGVIDSLSMLPGLTPSLKQQLNTCLTDISTAAPNARDKDLPLCTGIIDANREDAVAYAEAADAAEFAEKSAEQLNQQRQGLHQFWLQAGQLVLLNLLLPILTALLGYTFGQQAKV